MIGPEIYVQSTKIKGNPFEEESNFEKNEHTPNVMKIEVKR